MTTNRDRTLASVVNTMAPSREKGRFDDRTFRLSNEIGVLWIVLDVVTGLIPLIVDAATGNWPERRDGRRRPGERRRLIRRHPRRTAPSDQQAVART